MRGMIYILKKTGENSGKAYIGQTVNKKRFSNHKADFKAWLDGKQHYKSSYIVVSEGDFEYEILEEIDVENTQDLREREQFFIEKFKEEGFDIVNAFNAAKSKEEKDYNKRYYQENKEEIKKKMKERYLAERKDIIEKNKLYYSTKEKIKICCENCEMKILKTNMKRHLRSCKMLLEKASQKTELLLEKANQKTELLLEKANQKTELLLEKTELTNRIISDLKTDSEPVTNQIEECITSS
jgi:hypothetical protein